MSEVRYRVTELATAAGVSVDTVRFYQHRGLLPPPAREGRVAFYSSEHAERLERIRELKERGLSLEIIRRVLEGADPTDAALATAVAGSDERRLTLPDVADAAGVPVGLLDSLVAEGLLTPRGDDGHFTEADVRAVRAGMTLLEAGVPLNRLLELGRRYAESVNGVAEEAVDLFNEYVRRPSRADGRADARAGERVLQAFDRLLPAASTLVRHTFERAVLDAARRRLEEDDT